jgi:PDZ domain/Helix-turn-helix domain
MRDGLPSIVGGASSSELGWHGIQILHHPVDWPLCYQLGDGTVCVRVDPGSPARKAGLKTGDYLISVNGTTFEAFSEGRPIAGTTAVIKAFRKGAGVQYLEAVLIARPSPRPVTTRLCRPAIPCGRPVERNGKLKWLALVSRKSTLTPLDKAIATLLMTYYCNRKGDAYPSHATLARINNVCVRSVQRSISNLHRHGLLSVASRKKEGRSNLYSPCFPEEPSGKVVQIGVKGIRGGRTRESDRSDSGVARVGLGSPTNPVSNPDS